jgi:serine/threonine protein kinase
MHSTLVVARASRESNWKTGDRIADRYELDHAVRKGQDLWLASDLKHGRAVCLRLYDSSMTRQPGAVERMIEGARAASKLEHPAIIRVFGAGLHDKRVPFMVTEPLSGKDLGEAIRARGAMAPVGAVQCLLPIANAVDYANSKGIVHRNLIPDNVLLSYTEDGKIQPKLIDFGNAKLSKSQSQRVTAAGIAVGTPQYMSPEQTLSSDVSPATDVWGLSVLLYELLTGSPPFAGDSLEDLFGAICKAPATPFRILGETHAMLWPVVERGLEKRSEARWPSVRSFAAALVAFLQSADVEHDITGSPLPGVTPTPISRDFVPDDAGDARATLETTDSGWKWPIRRPRGIFQAGAAPAVEAPPRSPAPMTPAVEALAPTPRRSPPGRSPMPAASEPGPASQPTPSQIAEANIEARLYDPKAKLSVNKSLPRNLKVSPAEVFLALQSDGLTLDEAIVLWNMDRTAAMDLARRLAMLGVIRFL